MCAWAPVRNTCACSHEYPCATGAALKLLRAWPALAGVEHLLRDVKDATISTLATDVGAKLEVRCMLPPVTPIWCAIALQARVVPSCRQVYVWYTSPHQYSAIAVAWHVQMHLWQPPPSCYSGPQHACISDSKLGPSRCSLPASVTRAAHLFEVYLFISGGSPWRINMLWHEQFFSHAITQSSFGKSCACVCDCRH